MTDQDPREAINALVDQFADTLAEAVDAALGEVEDKTAETAYQDGLNDALNALRDWRKQFSPDEYDQQYIDGVDDAIITIIEAGAVDSDAADTAGADATVNAQQSAMDRTDDDTDGM